MTYMDQGLIGGTDRIRMQTQEENKTPLQAAASFTSF